MSAFVDYPSWISPTVFSFLPIRWYAVMYLVAFAITYLVFKYQVKKDHILNGIDEDTTASLFLYLIIGLIIGARLFSTLLYEGNAYYWLHPWMIFWPFRNGKFVGLPGMSYHGGAVGAAVGCALFCKRFHYRFYDVSDHILVGTPLGYTFGRLGNFINGELWGRCTGNASGMIFPYAPEFSTRLDWVRKACDAAGINYTVGDFVNLPRHPSQLYEAFFEGILLFIVIWFVVRPYLKKENCRYSSGFITGFYFIFYGFVRFVIEYFREPDEQLGFIIALGKESEPSALFKSIFNISMGQILCAMTIAIGFIIVKKSVKKTVKK